jgi:vacuolar-type H+-ATPase subunit I/STV1
LTTLRHFFVPQAIGQRNLVDNERELRKRKVASVKALIDERNAELARLTAEYDALARVELEQKDMIEKLLNNEPGGV